MIDVANPQEFAQRNVLELLRRELDNAQAIADNEENPPAFRRAQQIRRQYLLRMAAVISDFGYVEIEENPPALVELILACVDLGQEDLKLLSQLAGKLRGLMIVGSVMMQGATPPGAG